MSRITRQSEVDTPHFALPLRLGKNGHVFLNQQDTGDDILDCVKAIIAYPIDVRKDMPEFGIPDLLFRQQSGAIIEQVRQAISDWEDRATTEVEGEPAITDQMISNLLVSIGVTDG